ncbi:MAG: B12-binding domain-containing protein [Candidatus Thorarchaeota archaeon]
MSDKEILFKLKKSVLDFDEVTAIKAANEAIKAGVDPLEAIKNGLYPGLKEIADQYEQTVYLTDMILASDAFYAGANILKSKIKPEKIKANSKGIAILGVVKGDVHDLGKNMVKYLFEAEGFEIVDLGFDVPAEKFVEEAEKNNANLILVSVMLSSMFPEIGKIVEFAKKRNLQAKGVKIMAGGGPVTENIAFQQGADGWALTAPLAVKKALDLLK